MLQTKALYNLLRLNAAEDPTVTAEPWALEDLRALTVEELFSRLEEQNLALDKGRFLKFAEQCDTPEDLTELLFSDERSDVEKDPFYLLIFELWRRFLPEKQSLSIFFDELDHRIHLYDEDKLESDELIQDALANLLEVLDENADMGVEPREIFDAISDYCAHELESFIFDYISDLLDSENEIYASELIDGFTSYLSDSTWLAFLKVRLLSFSDISSANAIMHKLLEEKLEFALILEILRFLATRGEHQLFKIAVDKALPFVKAQEELSDILVSVADYYRRLDADELEAAVQKIIDLQQTGKVRSKDISSLQELLNLSV